ncbi:MAG: DUF2442 domain-containing protein [Clostridia bacterium]|nr:DUF2442 domain-containing protein [Clostridia bacterium]
MRARKKENYCLIVAFNDGSVREVDCTPLLNGAVFSPLKDQAKFDAFFVDLGTILWENGTIDIAPEWLYRNGKPVSSFLPDVG